MTKSDLVDALISKNRLPATHTRMLVDILLESLMDAMAESGRVELRGFGSFGVRQRRARVGRNPRTGRRVQVPPKRVPYFKPGRNLKNALNLDGPSGGA